jgi:hypothetical protein
MEVKSNNLNKLYEVEVKSQKIDSKTNTNETNKIQEVKISDSINNQKLKSGSALTSVTIGALLGAQILNEKKDNQSITLKDSLINNFKLFDKNNNGYISINEVKSLIKDSNIKGDQAVSLGILNFIMSNKENDNLSITDLSMLDTSKPIFKSQNSNKKLSLDDIKNDMESKLKEANKYKDSNGKFILPKSAKDIDFKDVKQGYLGDCYLIATLSSIAKQKPNELVKMIKDNNDGTFTVNFGDKKVNVSSPTDTEIALGSQGKSFIPIIEKAYAKYQNESSFIKSENPYDKISSGRTTLLLGKTIKELTNNNYDTDLLEIRTSIASFDASSKKETINKINNALKENKVIITSTEQNNSLNIAGNHAFSIIGFDPKTNTVEIRNPYGKGDPLDHNLLAKDGSNDGIFKISLEELYKNFTLISYEK